MRTAQPREGVTHRVRRLAAVNGIRMYYETAGDGPLLVLLHGWPQTSYCWRALVPPLARHFTVVTPDLRGYGQSDKPAHGYDKRTMAADVRALVEHLGHDRVRIVGHDRGARVGHRFGLDHPDVLDRLAVLDIMPTRAMIHGLDASRTNSFWHWFFHAQPDLPELLVGPQIRAYLTYFFERWACRRDAFDAATVDVYVEAFSRPGALRAGFDDYRATPADVTLDDEDAAAGRVVTAPVLALWGGDGGLLNRDSPVVETWSEYATHVKGWPVDDCGHFLPEEQPDAVLESLLPFLGAHA